MPHSLLVDLFHFTTPAGIWLSKWPRIDLSLVLLAVFTFLTFGHIYFSFACQSLTKVESIISF